MTIEAALRPRAPGTESTLTAGEKTKLEDRGIPDADEVEIEDGIAYFYLTDDTYIMTMLASTWTTIQGE